jgi:hypothetical protein
VSGSYEQRLNWQGSVRLSVRWTTQRSEVVDYAVTLVAIESGAWETIRVYDGGHGVNEMHRHTRGGGKHRGVSFHDGTLGEGMRAAVSDVRGGWAEMIEGWRR